MKKLLLVLAIGAFVACNNNTEGTEVKTDTPTTAPVTVDTPAVKVDSPAVKVDSPAVKVDSPATKK